MSTQELSFGAPFCREASHCKTIACKQRNGMARLQKFARLENWGLDENATLPAVWDR